MQHKNHDLLVRVRRFAVMVVKMTTHFPKREGAAWKIAEQVSDSAMSIYVNLREAQSARSKKEFISINGIALKESNETDGWLEIVSELGWIEKKYIAALSKESKELSNIIASIIIKSKKGK